MAGIKENIVELVLSLKDRLTGKVPEVTRATGQVDAALEKTGRAATKAGDQVDKGAGSMVAGLNKMRVAALAVVAAIGGLFVKVGEWVTLAATQERAEVKLATTLRNVSGATEAQIAALKRQASALQSVTGYGDEATISAQAMLGTFQLTAAEIASLTPALLDTAEGIRKLGNEQVDLEQVAVALGKAYTDGVGALKRYGVSLTAAQEEQFKFAQGAEKTAILVDVLQSNFGGLAAAVGQEYEGAARKADAAVGDLGEALGRLALSTGAPKDLADNTTTLAESLTRLADALAAQAQPQSAWVKGWQEAAPVLAAGEAVINPVGAAVGALTERLKDQGVTLFGIIDWLTEYTNTAKGVDPAAQQLADSTQLVADALTGQAAAANASTEQQRMLAEQMAGVEAEADRLNASVRANLEQFDALTSKGKSAAEAVQALAGELQLDSAAAAVVSVSAFAETLTELGTKAADTGNQIRATADAVSLGLGAALAKVSANELATFAAQWEATMAGLDGEPLEQLAVVMDGILGDALRRLSLDLESLRTNTTEAGREVVDVFRAAAIAAQGDAEIIGAAWDSVLTKLGTTGDIDRAREALHLLFSEGRIGLDALEQATLDLDAAQARLAATTGEVADAFRVLGVKSSAELLTLADEAGRAFETIRKSGTATTADLEAAWTAYARLAIDSGDQVAANAAREAAASLGLLNVYEQLAAAKAKGADQGNAAAAAAEREANATRQIADDRERQADAEDRISDAALRRRGVTREEYESGLTQRSTVNFDNAFAQYGADLGQFRQNNQGLTNYAALEDSYLAWLQTSGKLNSSGPSLDDLSASAVPT